MNLKTAIQKKVNTGMCARDGKFIINNTEYEIRLFDGQRDSVEQLTGLLHRAYKRLADMGLKFVATYQDTEYTRNYLKKGDCYILTSESKMLGTIFYYTSIWDDAPEIYKEKSNVLFGKLAVEPELQNSGLGSALMDFIERRAAGEGKRKIVLDTSEKAFHLIKYYEKRGYKYEQHWQWPMVNYRSVIMSKTLR